MTTSPTPLSRPTIALWRGVDGGRRQTLTTPSGRAWVGMSRVLWTPVSRLRRPRCEGGRDETEGGYLPEVWRRALDLVGAGRPVVEGVRCWSSAWTRSMRGGGRRRWTGELRD